MKTSDAKFLLRACRLDGRDAGDPLFAEAHAQAQSDPVLHGWLAREQAVDAVLAAKLAAVTPPAGLRDAILVGARASRPRRGWWQNPFWLAAAACLVVAGSLASLLHHSAGPAAPVTNAFALAALRDLAVDKADHLGHTPGLAKLEQRLGDHTSPVTAELAGFALSQLAPGGCRSITVGGHEVFELCFERDGKWFHLYAARRADFPAAASPAPVIATQAALAAATWADTNNIYAVVTDAGADALRQVL